MEAEEENGKDLFKYINDRKTIWKPLKSHKIADVSKLYEKTVFTLNINTGSGYDSLLIELGEYKWYATFLIFYFIIYIEVCCINMLESSPPPLR